METNYLAAAQGYAESVRAFFAITSPPTGERGEAAPASPEELVAESEKLSARSAALTAEAERIILTHPHPGARAQASTQLLAKALTDLEVSAHLFQAAVDEEQRIPWAERTPNERSVVGADSTEELLEIITGKSGFSPTAERGAEPPKDVAGARIELSHTIEDTLKLISGRTSKSGQAALTGLFGIGLGQAAQAAGLLGQNLAQTLGQAGKISALYKWSQDFAFKTYESIVASLGPQVTKVVGQQVMTWLGDVKEAKYFGALLEKIYRTQQTQEALIPVVQQSNADCQAFIKAIDEVEKLGELCSNQTALVDKLVKGIKFLGAIPVAILPYGALLMGAIYVAICGYVVLNGADYVDAEPIELLNRVPGVRQVVMTNLK